MNNRSHLDRLVMFLGRGGPSVPQTQSAALGGPRARARTKAHAVPSVPQGCKGEGEDRARRRPSASPGRAARTAALFGLLILSCAVSATPAVAEDCPNAALLAVNNSTRLPECRAYEMVTPLYKEGFPVETPRFSPEGEAVAFTSSGNFAGNPNGQGFNQYVAERTAVGWTTTADNPPADRYAGPIHLGADAMSSDLRSSLWSMTGPSDAEQNYYVREPDGTFTRIGAQSVPPTSPGVAFTVGTSADLSHVVFAHGGAGVGSPGDAALWEFVGIGNAGLPQAVSVTNDGQVMPSQACFGGMSSDARVIAFGSECNQTEGFLQPLWARVGGSATIAVSRSQCTRTSGDPGGACNAPADAHVAGMTADGSRVFFTTTQQLVNGDTDQTNDLYECDIPAGTPEPVGTANPCSSLSEVSHGATGADVQRVVRISEDGSHVYFIARGVLAANLGTNAAAAVAGEENLYVWEKDAAHPSGQTTFVTELESPIGFSRQTTPDGRYLLFQTASWLVPSDTDEAPDIYRYDAQTRAMLRISTDSSGTGGNAPGDEANIGSGPAMSADGSTVVFETSEALSPADTDGIADVYEWHEGQVSLISNGGTRVEVNGFIVAGAMGITPSGRDIFFKTGQPLTPGDSGTETDVYDARIDGGFAPSTPEPCSGAACQGLLAPQPQPPGTSASAAFNGPGSPLTAETPPANPPKPKAATAAQKLTKALRACRSKHNRQKRKACEKRARSTYRRTK